MKRPGIPQPTLFDAVYARPSPPPTVSPAPAVASAPQVDVVEEEPTRENNPDGLDLRAAAEEWMNGHPEVMKLFERFAAAMAARGRTFGVGLLTERVRWECAFEYGGDGDEYKINNNHRAYIARRLVLEHPELAPLMRFRETRY